MRRILRRAATLIDQMHVAQRHVAHRMAGQAGADRTVILILGSLSAYLPFQVLNGLETALAMAAGSLATLLRNVRQLTP